MVSQLKGWLVKSCTPEFLTARSSNFLIFTCTFGIDLEYQTANRSGNPCIDMMYWCRSSWPRVGVIIRLYRFQKLMVLAPTELQKWEITMIKEEMPVQCNHNNIAIRFTFAKPSFMKINICKIPQVVKWKLPSSQWHPSKTTTLLNYWHGQANPYPRRGCSHIWDQIAKITGSNSVRSEYAENITKRSVHHSAIRAPRSRLRSSLYHQKKKKKYAIDILGVYFIRV